MLPKKFYHDFNCEVKSYRYAFGPCWEPVIAMCNLCKFKIWKIKDTLTSGEKVTFVLYI